MSNKNVFIIIPCHNGWEYTRSCLSSILKSDYPNFNIIVVDDGSTDSTSEFIGREFPMVQVLLGDGNLWWTRSMNWGIREALKKDAEYVLVLNNDVLIATDTISALMECSIENPNAIIGSLIYNKSEPNFIWSAGGYLKWPWPGEIQIGIGELDSGQYNGVRKMSWTPGMGTFIKCDILMKLNLYDNLKMPHYIADVDFCIRAGKLGYPVLITSKSKIFNNIENTGGIKTSNKIKWSEIKEIFTSLRSADYFKARFTFILRHCRWYLVIPAIVIRYIRIFYFTLSRLL